MEPHSPDGCLFWGGQAWEHVLGPYILPSDENHAHVRNGIPLLLTKHFKMPGVAGILVGKGEGWGFTSDVQ